MDREDETGGLRNQLNRVQCNYHLLREWIFTSQMGHPIKNYLEKYGYKRVVIYGAGEIGLLLCRELQLASEAEIICFIDRVKQDTPFGIKVIQKYNKNLRADVVIVTPVAWYEAIRAELEQAGAERVVSLEEVILKA
ncbi:MAG: hypothetical protein LUH21_26745 [Clostridiales bacterium]|nr:hypothetical protein [Clostridiales bacterium]